ncbi:flagellar basal-body MS-ring/collar protein FliF [Sporobacter termitidis]|nr:flagellar basal-body MS-ring/collar protein FliF [Sporobacter termitidis]
MKTILKKTVEFFQNIEKKKLILLITLASVIVIAGIVGAILLNQVHYTVLYSGLDASEAGTVKTVLDGKGVKSKVQGTSTILVPEEQADTLRIELASEGYPSTGLNYDIFSGSSAIGSTDLERRTYLQYQLQENMRATIRRMEKVQDCIVIVNLAQDSSFVVSDSKSEASVAVELSLKDEETLSNTEARTIQEFVLKCVPNLKPENVSIVDSKMHYYNVNDDDAEEEKEQNYSVTQQQMTEQMKSVLTKQVLNVMEPVAGAGNVAVSVNCGLDFDKQTLSKVEFAPPVEGETSGLVRSSEETYSGTDANAGAAGAAGTTTNGSGPPAYVAPSPSPDGANGDYTKTYNYELNQIQTQIEKAQGTIQDLSVAVVVNSSIQGVSGYAENLKNLVAKSIGVKPDYVSVELIPFASNNSLSDAFAQNQQTMEALSRNKLITTIVTAGVVLAAIVIVAWFFFRKPKQRMAAQGQPLVEGAQPVGVTIGDFTDMPPDEEYDMADLVLKKSSEAEKIEELMDRYPETVAQILRTWLAEDN